MLFSFLLFHILLSLSFNVTASGEMWWYQILLGPQSPISLPACLEFNMKTAPQTSTV